MGWEVFNALIAGGANVNIEMPRGLGTALHAAAYHGHADVVDALLKNDVHANKAILGTNATPIELALRSHHVEVVKALLAKGIKPDQPCSDGFTLLFKATQLGDIKLVDALIKAGANVNKEMPPGFGTPLHIAASCGHAEVVSRLLQGGADANQCISETSITPLMIATKKGHTMVIDRLVAAGAQPKPVSGGCIKSEIRALRVAGAHQCMQDDDANSSDIKGGTNPGT